MTIKYDNKQTMVYVAVIPVKAQLVRLGYFWG